jgi:phosphoglycolate phosphatase-like HAD superfamily hydrolase
VLLFSYKKGGYSGFSPPSHNAIVSNLCYQVAAEKPNPIIFLKACELLGVKPEEAVHVGDDRRNDIWGARDAGCDAWLWGSDVRSFKEVFLFILDTMIGAQS